MNIPGEVCDNFSPYKHVFEDTAALIVGGFEGDNINPSQIQNASWIYGCDVPTVPLPDFPL